MAAADGGKPPIVPHFMGSKDLSLATKFKSYKAMFPSENKEAKRIELQKKFQEVAASQDNPNGNVRATYIYALLHVGGANGIPFEKKATIEDLEKSFRARIYLIEVSQKDTRIFDETLELFDQVQRSLCYHLRQAAKSCDEQKQEKITALLTEGDKARNNKFSQNTQSRNDEEEPCLGF